MAIIDVISITGGSQPITSGGGATGQAPNITSATATVNYCVVSDQSSFYFSGVITLPTGDSKYSSLKSISVIATTGTNQQGLEVCRLFGPWNGSTVSFTGISQPMPPTTQTWALTFLALDDASVAASGPYQITGLTVQASAITAVTASASGLSVDQNTRLVSTTVSFIPTFAGNIVPQNVSYWVSSYDDQTKWTYIGWSMYTSVGASVSFSRLVPASQQTWKVAVAPQTVGGTGGATIPSSALPSNVVISAGFSVAGLQLPSANGVTNASIPAGSGGNNPYNQVRPDGSQYVYIPPITYTDPSNDPNAFFIRTTCQCVDSSGNPAPANQGGTEVAHGGTQVTGSTHLDNTDGLMFDYNPTGSPYTTMRFRVYSCNRQNMSTNSFQDSTCAVLQHCWSGGADHYDVYFGPFPTSTNTDTGPTNLLDNAGFESGLSTWININTLPGYTTYGNMGTSTVAHSGGHSASFTAPTQGQNSWVYQEIPCKVGDTFYAEVYVQSSANAASVGCLSYWFMDSSGNMLSNGSLSSSGASVSWVKLSGSTSQAPANTYSVRIFVGTNGVPNVNDSWYFDDAVLRLQTPSVLPLYTDPNNNVTLPSTNISNMIINGDYEAAPTAANPIPAWTIQQGTVSLVANQPTHAHTGSNFLSLTANSGGLASVVETNFHIVKPGEQYYVEGWGSAGAGTTGALSLNVFYYQNDGTYLSADTQALHGNGSAQVWQKLSLTITVPSNASKLVVGWGVWSETNGKSWYVDSTWLSPATSVGPGLTPDGDGGVKSGNDNTSNLVLNPSFEDGVSHWILSNGATPPIVASSSARTGKNVFQSSSDQLMYGDWIACKPGENYYCETWVMGQSGNNGVFVFAVAYGDKNKNEIDGNWSYGPYTYAVASGYAGVWTKYSFNLTIPTSLSGVTWMRPQIQTYTQTAGTIMVDDVTIKPQLTGPNIFPDSNGGAGLPTNNLSNLVLNPGWETGDLTGWIDNQGSCYAQFAPGGCYSGNFYAVLSGGSGSVGELFELNSHSCKPGDSFYAEAWIFLPNGCPGGAGIYIYWYDHNNTYMSPASGPSHYTVTQNAWTKVSLTATAPTGASYCRVSVYCSNMTTGSYAVCDSVLLKPQTSTGNGTGPDGNGGVQIILPTNSEFSFDSNGNLVMTNVDMSKATKLSSQFAWDSSAQVQKIVNIDASVIKTGAFQVGGPGMVSQSKNFDTSGNLIGFIGDDSANSGWVGAWFKRVRLGGSSVTDVTHQIATDIYGNIVVPGSIISGDIQGKSANITGTLNVKQIGTGSLPTDVIYTGTLIGDQINGGTISAIVTMSAPRIIGGSISIIGLDGGTTQIGSAYSGLQINYGAYQANLTGGALQIQGSGQYSLLVPNALQIANKVAINTTTQSTFPYATVPQFVGAGGVNTTGPVTCASLTLSATSVLVGGYTALNGQMYIPDGFYFTPAGGGQSGPYHYANYQGGILVGYWG